MKRVPGQTGGLVFLNACRTAESGDLGSFLKTFHNAEFSGLIATEEQTLDSFANPFGLGVLEQFFTPGNVDRRRAPRPPPDPRSARPALRRLLPARPARPAGRGARRADGCAARPRI